MSTKKRCSHENLLHVQIKPRPCRWHNRQYPVGAACRLFSDSNLAESIVQPKDLCSTTQAVFAEGKATCAASDSPGPAQDNCFVDHKLLHVQCSFGQDHYTHIPQSVSSRTFLQLMRCFLQRECLLPKVIYISPHKLNAPILKAPSLTNAIRLQRAEVSSRSAYMMNKNSTSTVASLFL